MMKTTDGFAYAFNAQAVVDEEAQVIVAHSVTNQATDVQQLVEMIEATEANLGAAGIDENPDTFITDAGYFSEKNVNDATDAGVDVLIATGRIKHHERVPDAPRGPIPKDATVKEKMARRLRTKAGRADYARRKAIVEPVFGQTKVRQSAGFLRLRGLQGAQVSGPCTRSATTCESWPGQPHRKARKASLRHRPLTQRACRPPVPRHCLSGSTGHCSEASVLSHWSIPTHAPRGRRPASRLRPVDPRDRISPTRGCGTLRKAGLPPDRVLRSLPGRDRLQRRSVPAMTWAAPQASSGSADGLLVSISRDEWKLDSRRRWRERVGSAH